MKRLVLLLLLFISVASAETYLAIFLDKDFEINKVVVCKTLNQVAEIGSGNAIIYKWDFNQYKITKTCNEIDNSLRSYLIGFYLDKRIRDKFLKSEDGK